MTPKEARSRLFAKDRPTIRPLNIEPVNGQMGPDMKILWAAYRKGSFPHLGELDQEQFTERTLNELGRFQLAWIVDDRNSRFGSNYGPVAIITATFDGWAVTPHWTPFAWASARNRLRTVVAFMQMARYDKQLGVVNLTVDEPAAKFFHKVAPIYGVLWFVGKIPRGDFGIDRHIFYGRGGAYFRSPKSWAA